MKRFLALVIFSISCLHADESDTVTLFSITEQKGTNTVFAENGTLVGDPKAENDKISGASVIQMQKGPEGVNKFYLVHNNGTSELAHIKRSNSWTFVECLGDSVFTHMICFDHKYADGSYLYIGSGSRSGFLGVTSGRIFSGKAYPGTLVSAAMSDRENKGDSVNGEGAEDSSEVTRAKAEQGDAVAQLELGFSYTLGQGVAKDEKEAVKWFRKAAEQGLADAQFNLGNGYADGQDVVKNEVEAYKWLLIAAANGAEGAKKNVVSVENRLAPAQRAEGQRLATDWQAKFEEEHPAK